MTVDSCDAVAIHSTLAKRSEKVQKWIVFPINYYKLANEHDELFHRTTEFSRSQ